MFKPQADIVIKSKRRIHTLMYVESHQYTFNPTFCPARKFTPRAADIPSTAAGDTPAVMHAALQPSFMTKALACRTTSRFPPCECCSWL